jgi:SAM-dependent methyltransferase
MTKYTYPLSNEWEAARERLTQLEAFCDPWTIANLQRLPLKTGWRCLEAAAGGGSIAAWLCTQVGGSGRVIATDLEPRLLEAIEAPNLEIRRHDLLADSLPESYFDLVHARAVLTFLPKPDEVIRKLISALKPGSWLVLEEPDYVCAVADSSMSMQDQALSGKAWGALLHHLRSRGYDTEFGRHLYHDLSRHGLTELSAGGYVAMQIGGTPTARFWKITFEQVAQQLLAAGLLSSLEAERYRALLESSEYRWLAPVMMCVSGRRVLA